MNEDFACKLLEINPEIVMKCLEHDLKAYLKSHNRYGVVVGLSGGMDSSTTLMMAVKILGPEKVWAINMPDRDSLPHHTEHAKLLAEMLDLDTHFEVIDITPSVKSFGVYDLMGKNVSTEELRKVVEMEHEKQKQEGSGRTLFLERLVGTNNPYIGLATAYTFSKHAVRSVYLYLLSNRYNLLVANTANRTESTIGYFTDLGPDAAGHFAFLVGLWRTQVEQLAENLGLPGKILNKLSDPDAFPGVHDKEDYMFIDYLTLDSILECLRRGLTKNDIVKLLEVSPKDVDYVQKLCAAQANRNVNVPFVPKFGI